MRLVKLFISVLIAVCIAKTTNVVSATDSFFQPMQYTLVDYLMTSFIAVLIFSVLNALPKKIYE